MARKKPMKKFFAALLMLGAFNSYAGIRVDATRDL